MEAIDPVYGTATLLLIAAAAVALLLVLIMVLKLHAFISLVLVSLLTAIAVGFELAEIPDVLLYGFADTIGSVALLVAFGVMLGRLLEVTGGAQVLADTLIGAVRREAGAVRARRRRPDLRLPDLLRRGPGRLPADHPHGRAALRRLAALLRAPGGRRLRGDARDRAAPPGPGRGRRGDQRRHRAARSSSASRSPCCRGTSASTWSSRLPRRADRRCRWPTSVFGKVDEDHDGEDDAAFGQRPPAFATVLGLLLIPLVLISFDTVLTTLVTSGTLEEATWVDFLSLHRADARSRC